MGKMKGLDSHKMSDGTKKRELARVKYMRYKGGGEVSLREKEESQVTG